MDRLEVNSGQRYSVLVKMDQEIGTYQIKSKMIPGPGPSNGIAFLEYEGAKLTVKDRRKNHPLKTKPENLTRWEGSKLSPKFKIQQLGIYSVPETVDKEIVITTMRKKSQNIASNDDKSTNQKEKEEDQSEVC